MEKKVPIEVKGTIEVILNGDLYQLSIDEARELMNKLKAILDHQWWYPYPYPWSYTCTNQDVNVRMLPDGTGTPNPFPFPGSTITCSSDQS